MNAKTSKAIGLIALIISMALPLYAGAMSCADLLSGKLAQPNVLESLHSAAKDDYAVQVFTKEVNGQKRTLVLMGEVHIKSEQSAAVGREVINNFDYVGREGFDPEKTWGGRFKSQVVAPLFAKVGIKEKPQFWFARLLGKIMGRAGRTQGSTITEAQVAEMRNNLVKNLKSMSPQELADFVGKLEEIPEQNRDGSLSIDGVTLFTVREILELAKLTVNGRELPTMTGPKETIHLEAGHKPDVWENLDSIDNYITVGLLAGYYTAASFLPPDIAMKGAIAINALSMYQLTGTILSSTRFQTARWYQRLFPLSLGVIRGRNATMVNNIEGTFNGRQHVDHLLAIVGKNHVPEMKLLLERMGYTSVALPEPVQMQMQDAVDAATVP